MSNNIQCGAMGPREASSSCLLPLGHEDEEHKDSSGGTWPK